MKALKQRQGQQESQEASEDVCEECGCGELEQHSDEVICGECGLVIDEDYIDRGPEWRAFNSKERQEKKRVGSGLTPTMHDRGLSTEIGNIDTSGFSRRKREKIKRLQQWDSRSKNTSKERGLRFSLGEIERLTSKLELPKSVHEVAAVVFRKAHDAGLVKGRSFEGMAAAAVYIASRQRSMARTMDEVAEYARLQVDDEETDATSPRQRVFKSYQKMAANLDIDVGPPDPAEYISRFVTIVREAEKERGNAPDHKTFAEIEKIVHEIVEATKDEGLHSGREPASVMASSIYLAQLKKGVGMTQEEVAEPCGVTQVAIRGLFREQAELMDIDIPKRARKSSELTINNFGEVKDKESKDFAERLFEYFDPDNVEHRATVNGQTVDFLIDNSYVVDITTDEKTAATVYATDYIYVTFEDRDVQADYQLDWEVRQEVARRLSDL